MLLRIQLIYQQPQPNGRTHIAYSPDSYSSLTPSLIGVSRAALIRADLAGLYRIFIIHFPEGTVYTTEGTLFSPHVRLPVPAGCFCQLDDTEMGRHLREQLGWPSCWTDLPGPRRHGAEYRPVGRGDRDD
jgi:hypothetical protein